MDARMVALYFQWIQDNEAKSREHEEAVKKLISRHKVAGKVGSRWRINVLKKELMGGSALPPAAGKVYVRLPHA